jgi:hypothetical protein
MILVSENARWVACWTNNRRQEIKIISKQRKRDGIYPYTARAYKDGMDRIIISSEFSIPVNVESWCSKALQRGFRYQ